MKLLYIGIAVSLLGVIILSTSSSSVEYETVTVKVYKSDADIIAEKVAAIMASDAFQTEMRHVAMARAMIELSGEYIQQAEVLQAAGFENLQQSSLLAEQHYHESGN